MAKKLVLNSCWGCPHGGYSPYGGKFCYLSDKTITRGSFENWCRLNRFPSWCQLQEDESDALKIVLDWIRENEVKDIAAFKSHLIRKINNRFLGKKERARHHGYKRKAKKVKK